MIGDITNVRANSMAKAVPERNGLVAVYAIFIIVAVLIFHWIAEGEFSAVLTLSAIFQCLAVSLLALHALSTGSVHGISVKSLQLEAVALACRLSSTTWLDGYLPADQTGDYLYQAFDALSLVMLLWLLYRVRNIQIKTCESEDDTLPMLPFALGSLVLAAVLHGDLDDRPLFDCLWMCGLFTGTVAVLPQLSLMTRDHIKVPAMASHFVAVMAISRILSGTYMWHAHEEISCEQWITGFNHAGWAIVGSHVVHLMLLGDFAYFYGKNLATRGLQAPLELPGTWMV